MEYCKIKVIKYKYESKYSQMHHGRGYCNMNFTASKFYETIFKVVTIDVSIGAIARVKMNSGVCSEGIKTDQ